MKRRLICALLSVVIVVCTGCSAAAGMGLGRRTIMQKTAAAPQRETITYTNNTTTKASTPLQTTLAMRLPRASGIKVLANEAVSIDVSNASNGYMMVKYLGSSSDIVKMMVQNGSGPTYLYTLSNRGNYESFPFSEGNGTYSIKVYKNIGGSRYVAVYTTTTTVSLKNKFSPFLISNQFVNYNSKTLAVKQASKLSKGVKTELVKLTKIYNWVVGKFKYDTQLARTVQSGYIPNLNSVYKKKKGICFDYAAIMTAMLRSQGMPCKLVIGYAGSAYHAWINVYTKKSGWIDGAIFFNGKRWRLLDPTFASTAHYTGTKKYVGNGTKYVSKFTY